jgi:hypothetical protein
VNGKVAKAKLRDGFRNGRIAIVDIQPLLIAGDNLIAIDVSSHTEKQMNDVESKKFPASITHLNARSGVAFYARCVLPDGAAVQLGSDESWRVQRNPEGAWNALALDDRIWQPAAILAANATPIDEGPGLEPITRKDFANMPADLGSQLAPAVGTAAQTGRIRAAQRASDPRQTALDRPNREIVTPVRANAATTIQALELTNGATLDDKLQSAAATLAAAAATDPAGWLDRVFRHALSRTPSAAERGAALALLGAKPQPEAIADLLWAIVNQPEFQLIN